VLPLHISDEFLKNHKEMISCERLDYLPSSEALRIAYKHEVKSETNTIPQKLCLFICLWVKKWSKLQGVLEQPAIKVKLPPPWTAHSSHALQATNSIHHSLHFGASRTMGACAFIAAMLISCRAQAQNNAE
jgi:hypothetical protein